MNCSSTVGLLEPLSDLTATGGKGLPTTTIPAPLTSHPDVPDDSKFMKQGVDPAFARAQLVDPHLTTPLPPDEEQSADIGLSAKTLRRLKDLGITELFAGAYDIASTTLGLSCATAVQTTLLPLLLPSDRLKRSLYLPYDPPSDLCVSAPTGSGKTLAYVLPIVEVGTLSSRRTGRQLTRADTLFSCRNPFARSRRATDP
jgi:ATP-dependent RNA helicase DDX51/DBP6